MTIVPTDETRLAASYWLSDSGRKPLVWATRLLIVGGFIAVWQVSGTRSDYSKLVFSTPTDVLAKMVDWVTHPSWWHDVSITLTEALLGWALGIALAAILIAIIAPSQFIKRFMAPFVAALNALPKVALAPVFLLWFGIGVESKAAFVASLISFIVFYGLLGALDRIDQLLVDNMKILGASRMELLCNVYGPAMLGQVIASLRLSAAWSLLGAVLAEYLAADAGLGFLIARGQQEFQTDTVIAGILVVAISAGVVDRVLVCVERRLSRWKAT